MAHGTQIATMGSMSMVRSSRSDARWARWSRIIGLNVTGLMLVAGCAGAGATGAPAQPAPAAAQAKRVAELPAPAPRTDAQPTSSPDEVIEPVAVPIPGSELVRGRATVEVRAPLPVVRDAVLGFGSYPDFMPHYENCKLLGRTPSGARDVYMEISALHGAVRMWARVEVNKRVEEGAEVFETRMVEGNVDDMVASWRLRRLDTTRTELSLEVFLKPRLPMPVELMNRENMRGAVKGVVAMRSRAEQMGAEKSARASRD